jgi:C4-type Zn-finger protein
MSDKPITFWHKMEHKLHLNSEFDLLTVEGEWIIHATVCETCGWRREEIKLCKQGDLDMLMAKIRCS